MATPAWKLESNQRSVQRRVNFIRDYKESRGCTDCGLRYPHFVLEFDHVPERGKKSHKLDPTRFGMDRLMMEIAKCDVVCGNCHNIRTWQRSQGPMPMPPEQGGEGMLPPGVDSPPMM